MAIEALRQVHEIESLSFGGVRISNVGIHPALVVLESDCIEIVTCLHTTEDQDYIFTLESSSPSGRPCPAGIPRLAWWKPP